MTTDFGRDTYCVDSLQTGRYVSGAALVAQRLYHALRTPRGALRGSPEHEQWGEDIEELVGAPGGQDTQRKIRAKVARAASKDEQILKVSTDIVETIEPNGAGSYVVSVSADTADGPFNLVLGINSVTVELIGMSA